MRTPRFTDWLIDANGFDPKRFTQWLFQPGMLFRAADKWWGDCGRRDFAHEGIDFGAYQDDAGTIQWLGHGTRVPALFAGVIRSIFSDYLGQAIVVEHAQTETDDSRRISIYAHTVPLTGIAPGMFIDAGDVIATIAATSHSNTDIQPHLHYSLGRLCGTVDFRQFMWNRMRDPNYIRLLDPLDIIDWPYRVLHHRSDAAGRLPARQTGK